MISKVLVADSPRITVSQGGQAQADLGKLMSVRPDLAAGRPYAFVINNTSTSTVVALTIRWSWIGSDGATHTHTTN